MMKTASTSLIVLGLLASSVVRAEMIPSSQAGNDPQKARLCASRAGTKIPGKLVPFEIDPTYVDRARSFHPDVTFIAIDDGTSPQLVECYLREGTGKYEPAVFSPEQQYWHLIKPEGSGIDTPQARSAAMDLCEKAALSKLTTKGFDHAVQDSAVEVTPKRAGSSVGGKLAERYDVWVDGAAFYKSNGPDLKQAKYSCLLSRAPEFVPDRQNHARIDDATFIRDWGIIPAVEPSYMHDDVGSASAPRHRRPARRPNPLVLG
jgi:hypothetical protein